MADEQRPGDLKMRSQHVDKINVDGQILSADEILARAQQRVQKKQQSSDQKTLKKRLLTPDEIAAIKAKNDQSRQQIIKKKPSLVQNQKVDPFSEKMPTLDMEQQAKDSNQATLVKGSAWLSVGNIVSRILGAIYIVPWMALLGSNSNRANGLFSQGYTIYAIFLAIATFGVPAAISKLVAEFNARHDIYQSRQLMRQSMILGVILGIVFGSAIYLLTPILSMGNANFIPVLHSLAPAVAIFPLMSMLRGIFQGYQLMSISALSQVIEQIARVIYMLVTAVIILRVNPGNWSGVVVQSTFAAFIGAIFSMLVLIWGWFKYRYILIKPLYSNAQHVKKPTLSLIFNILKESWPFIIIGSAITLFQLVDQYTYFNIMNHFFANTNIQLQTQFALFSANPNKLIMIIVPFSTSIAATALPMLSGSKATLTRENIQDQLKQVIKLFALVMFPSALGMFAIAAPLYKMFYPIDVSNQEGIYLLQFSTILAIVFSLFMLLAFVLQALSEVSIVIKAFVLGLLVKIALQVPSIRYFEGMGALIASMIGMAIAIAYMLDYLQAAYGVSLSSVGQELWQLFIGAATMAIVSYVVVFLMSNFLFPMDTKVSVTITALISAAIGGIVVIILYLRMGFGDDLLGNKIRYIPAKLRPKR
ncbi:transporter [Leuconostoc gasicomitatum]|uniref:Membrane protein involved in the export of O-antigen, teichoic acid lipoteichoic acids n=2 Tax=Leuconostoc TaxID=1243 RepID=A0AAN2QVE1_9LACO|nr:MULTISPECIES: polysaccharide biosynthesis protein [Leuconostoc]MBZ5948313.1 polysaccharide biosynthesis protein [Leuconostoc gasicomitatum]MBZ5956427.1 polysaccharide biosynthesis protein [Leuconostoc gasicomitatum]MBZ5959613.1 polysaccharide biosynthesis protein [Leuconostoc gasicomitatum]MBZ5966346.1 polysaccharide biosynthesis protein [Leuconostoc gasicomitatum]MBZ5979598.1 polysaccharide biosynthesis protein [Leuconostoc gasicomitatum]